MKILFHYLSLAVVALFIVGCGQKPKTDDIIATKAEKPKLKGPIRMQDYTQNKDIVWLGKNYQVVVRRTPDDSLRMVADETGQKFVDNRISLRIIRADGSEFVSRSFTKAAFESFIPDDYRRTGILEGLVFDKVDGSRLCFAASVSLPQTDEYVPLVVAIDHQGSVSIRPDTDLDTNGDGTAPEDNGDDEP